MTAKGLREIDLVATFDLACKQAGFSHKQVAAMMGIGPEQLYQMLRQHRPLNLARLLQMRDDPDGRRFLRCYWPLVGEAMGFAEFNEVRNVADALCAYINHMQTRITMAKVVDLELRDEQRSA